MQGQNHEHLFNRGIFTNIHSFMQVNRTMYSETARKNVNGNGDFVPTIVMVSHVGGGGVVKQHKTGAVEQQIKSSSM